MKGALRPTVVLALPVEVLRRYLGNYGMEGPGGAQTYVVELVAGTGHVFWITGQRLGFFLDGNGQVTHFVMTIVEGDLKALRK